ncbi:hypothetical protein BT67DRAFT_200995 [Trichocladium antarcticum]|uniref:Uncharacterized protein n=1 Tax=Trichocladium antarcticum TaxID=1450529 RepID=A0AAN6USG3_9PEZI|nr:hypothetical protein BT67DRAFT_200995 [Trichocladium antarcticum]
MATVRATTPLIHPMPRERMFLIAFTLGTPPWATVVNSIITESTPHTESLHLPGPRYSILSAVKDAGHFLSAALAGLTCNDSST